MNDLDMKGNIDSTVIDLLSEYHMLKSTVNIFNEAVDYDTNLDSKYNDMMKLINMLVLNLEVSIELLCKQLKELLKSTED